MKSSGRKVCVSLSLIDQAVGIQSERFSRIINMAFMKFRMFVQIEVYVKSKQERTIRRVHDTLLKHHGDPWPLAHN